MINSIGWRLPFESRIAWRIISSVARRPLIATSFIPGPKPASYAGEPTSTSLIAFSGPISMPSEYQASTPRPLDSCA
jgi:hypothetical protein